MKRRTTSFLLLILSIFFVHAADQVIKVEKEYKYIGPTSESIDEATRKAFEMAKREVIAEKFGTRISINNSTTTSTHGNTQFTSIAQSEVKGDWIETTEEKVLSCIVKERHIYVTVLVKGKIRENTRPSIDFTAVPLCNGTDHTKFESDRFKDGNDVYLYFRSPVDGYVAVYLLDVAGDEVFCMLPYRNSNGEAVKVQKDKDYVFFSKKEVSEAEKAMVDEYTLSTEAPVQTNVMCVLFSTEPFAKADLRPNEKYGSLKTCTLKEFERWRNKELGKNSSLNYKQIDLTIEK